MSIAADAYGRAHPLAEFDGLPKELQKRCRAHLNRVHIPPLREIFAGPVMWNRSLEKERIMKSIVAVVGAACLLFSTIDASASDRDALEIEGSYILYQDDDNQRVISLDRSGNVVMASDLQPVVGFTSGVGAWEQTGPDSATARIVNFNFNVDTGQPMGPAIGVYDLTFGDLVQGKYQTVTGYISGGQYELGQDPLAPTVEPYREFGITFEGKRITAE
jgi:hypothetical protein